MSFDGLRVSADAGRCKTRLTTSSSVVPKNGLLLSFKAAVFWLSFLCRVPVLQVVELISGGAQIGVTNENKMHYLNLLAQYRLATQVRDEVEHFLKGEESL